MIDANVKWRPLVEWIRWSRVEVKCLVMTGGCARWEVDVRMGGWYHLHGDDGKDGGGSDGNT